MKLLLASGNESLINLIETTLSRFPYEIDICDNGLDVFHKAVSQQYQLMILDYNLPPMGSLEVLKRLHALENTSQPSCLCLTATEEERLAVEGEHLSKVEVFSKPVAIREFVDKIQQILHQEVRIVCVGGGTGLFTLLSGLKTLSGVRLSSIVTMSDDGGSTGRLRSMFGILPPGDVRRSLVALSTAPDLVNELIQYRFERGEGLAGHNMGNLLLTALSEMRGSMLSAVRSLSEILNIQGDVIPVTENFNTLKAKLENGEILEGEHRIDLFEGHDHNLKIERLWLEPQAAADPSAIEALLNAKYIILGPGDLFTSIMANLVVRGIPEAIAASKARKIYICNVMTKPGETTGFQVHDHVEEIVKYLGSDCLDDVICGSTQFSDETLAVYAEKGQIPVMQKEIAKLQEVTKAQIHFEDIVSDRELVRHDSLKLSNIIKGIIENSRKAVKA